MVSSVDARSSTRCATAGASRSTRRRSGRRARGATTGTSRTRPARADSSPSTTSARSRGSAIRTTSRSTVCTHAFDAAAALRAAVCDSSSRRSRHARRRVAAPARRALRDRTLSLRRRRRGRVRPRSATTATGSASSRCSPSCTRDRRRRHRPCAPLASSCRVAVTSRRAARAGRAWTGGPLSEPARQAVRSPRPSWPSCSRSPTGSAAERGTRRGDWVVTHGEPHAGNVMRLPEGAAPRRLGHGGARSAGARPLDARRRRGRTRRSSTPASTGTQPNDAALDFFRLTWELKDLAEYINIFRSPHEENDDTLRQIGALDRIAAIRDLWASRKG